MRKIYVKSGSWKLEHKGETAAVDRIGGFGWNAAPMKWRLVWHTTDHTVRVEFRSLASAKSVFQAMLDSYEAGYMECPSDPHEDVGS
jgi:hypothetical protein